MNTITSKNHIGIISYAALNVYGQTKGNGTLTITNTGSTTDNTYGIYANEGYTQTSASVTIESSFANDKNTGLSSYGLYVANGSFNITGGTLDATAGNSDGITQNTYGVFVNGSDENITIGTEGSATGPTLKATASDASLKINALQATTITVNCGNVEVDTGTSTETDVNCINCTTYTQKAGKVKASGGFSSKQDASSSAIVADDMVVLAGSFEAEVGSETYAGSNVYGINAQNTVFGSETSSSFPTIKLTSYNAKVSTVALQSTKITSYNADITARSQAALATINSYGIYATGTGDEGGLTLLDGSYKFSASTTATTNKAALKSEVDYTIDKDYFKLSNLDESTSDTKTMYQSIWDKDLKISSNILILLEGETQTEKYAEEG